MYYGTEPLAENEIASIKGNFSSADFTSFFAEDPNGDGAGRGDAGDTDGGAIGGGFVFCFSGDATCLVEGRGDVPMKDISLGDRVMVEGGKYEAVYSFGHRAPNVKAEFIELVTAVNELALSKDHMVFVDGGRSVPASHVKVGDQLELASGIFEEVRTIRTVVRQGAYAPFTASGALIVNGVKASSFIAFQDSETLLIAGVNTGLTFQFLARASEAPHRIWCQYFSACLEEQYTAEGISTWVDGPHKAGLWFIEQNSVVMTVLALPLLSYLALMAFPLACLSSLLALLITTKINVRVTKASSK